MVLDHSRDTGVDRVLVSESFVYFGGEGPQIPHRFRNFDGEDLCKKGRGRKNFDNPNFVDEFGRWIISLAETGYAGRPLEWVLSP